MAIATQRFTLEDYLSYDDGTNTRYELFNGELIPMGIGSGLHSAIIKFLERYFDTENDRRQRDWVALPSVLGVQSPRGGRWDTVRIPDISLIPKTQFKALRDREAVIRLNEPPPLLVVEVVSESTQSTDYRAKRSEYSVLNIPEYWIVDPLDHKVTVLSLEEGWYEAVEFQGADVLQSATFPDWTLTAEQVLQGEL